MPWTIIRTEDEIDRQINDAQDQITNHRGRSKWPSMTYEEGVVAALSWLTDNDATPPMDEDA